jgi:hypothetical protein
VYVETRRDGRCTGLPECEDKNQSDQHGTRHDGDSVVWRRETFEANHGWADTPQRGVEEGAAFDEHGVGVPHNMLYLRGHVWRLFRDVFLINPEFTIAGSPRTTPDPQMLRALFVAHASNLLESLSQGWTIAECSCRASKRSRCW